MYTFNPTSRRDGFALPVALLAIMVIGAIVTGGFYASSQESRISTSSDLGNQAFYVAEYGLEEALGTWMNEELADVGDSLVLDPETVTTGGQTLGSYTLTIRRMGTTLFLVSSEGQVQAGPRTARREVGTLVRTMTPTMPAPTALAIFGGLSVGGNSYIRGHDNCNPSDTLAGVTAYDSTLVENKKTDHITGAPPIDENTGLDTTALSDFGALQLADLIAAANITYSAGESENGMAPVTTVDGEGNAVCDESVSSNWGDASGIGPCADYFPIIHAEGDLHLRTGGGQGILIVDGDLQASGNFDFYGVVIVRGELFTTGTGNHFEGSVIVQGNGSLDSESTTLGNSLVQYNHCTTQSAFNAALRPRPLASRSWIDFTAITRGVADEG